MHVADTRLDLKVKIDTVAGNLVTYDGELERLVGPLTQDGDMNRGAFGPFQQVGYIGRGQIVGGLAIDGRNDVPGANARAIGGSSGEGSNDDNLIVARSDGHAHAVVLAALVLAQQRVGLGVEEIGVRIKHVQHARDRPVVDGFVGVHRFGIILLNDVVNLGKLLE